MIIWKPGKRRPMTTTERQKGTDDQVERLRRLRRRLVWPFFVGPLIVKDYTWESKYIFTSHVSGHWAVFKVTRIRHTQFLLRHYVCVQAVIVKDWICDLSGLLHVFELIWWLQRLYLRQLFLFLRWRYQHWIWRRTLQDIPFKVWVFKYAFDKLCVSFQQQKGNLDLVASF